MIWGHSIRTQRGVALPMPRRRSWRRVDGSGRYGYRYRRIQRGKPFTEKYLHGTCCGNWQVQNKKMEEKGMERMKTAEAMKVFEGRAEMFVTDFGEALAHVKDGGKAARNGWPGWNQGCMWIRLVEPEGTSDFDYGMENRPYLELKTADDTLVPWVATQEDLLAEDWLLLNSQAE